MKKFLVFGSLVIAILIGLFLLIPGRGGKRESASLIKSWGKFPIYFVENEGQVDRRVGFYVKGSEKTLYFGPSTVTISIHQAEKKEGVREAQASVARWNVKMDFVGANEEVRLEGKEESEAKISYFKGPRKDWKTGIKTYRSIAYRELWPGVDLIYSGSIEKLKQDFIVRPGADAGRIRLAYLGAESVTMTDAGRMEIRTPLGGFQDERPVAYQIVGKEKVAVDVSYDLTREGDRYEYGFRLGRYDPTKELTIDPLTFIYAGFIGGSGSEVGQGIAVDTNGNVYVTGYTDSTEATFPATVGPDLTQNGGMDDAFVAKVKADGTGLDYAGFIGGSGSDVGQGIAVDTNGNAYVTGRTSSTEATFPAIVGPDLTWNGGLDDAFVAKVNSNGTGLVYAGFIGGNVSDRGYGIAVDGGGNAYVTGETASTEATFPAIVGPDLTLDGGGGAFVAKVKADGTGLDYAGFIGGQEGEIGHAIAVDTNGNAYVTGEVNSGSTFPATVGPDLTHNGGDGGFDAFVAKVKADGTGLDYAGFIGGDANDRGYGIAVDADGNAYVTGPTGSTEATFPATVGPDLTWNGGNALIDGDAFVAKVKADGTGLDYAGFIGGDLADLGFGIAVDADGNAYVTGYTGSTEATFPVTVGPDLTQNGVLDAFVAKVKADGTGLDYAGFVGGSANDFGYGIAVDAGGNAYVTGSMESESTEATFPATVGPGLTQNGGIDAFVAKIGDDGGDDGGDGDGDDGSGSGGSGGSGGCSLIDKH